jgi:uncharacterized membrane protein
MDLSIFIAKIIGVTYLVIGLAFLLNTDYYRKVFSDILKNTTFIFISGIMALVIGIAIIFKHNIWVADWTVLITIVGWIADAKGALLLVFPKSVKYFDPWFQNKGFLVFAGAFALVFGIVLCYFEFYA